MRITVIVPTYNEAETLPRLVSVLLSLPLAVSVLVVDDDSPDGTGRLADELAAAHPGRVAVHHRPGKLGLRSAYLEGFALALASEAEAVAQMDADFSHDPAMLAVMAGRLASCDVVLGSRYVPGGSLDQCWPRWRKALSAFGNFYVRTILGLPLRDITTGFRLWRRTALESMPLGRIRASGYVFLVEMAYLAACLGFRFGEVPIHFAERQAGRSKMSFAIQAEAALNVWLVLWRYRDLRRKGMMARAGAGSSRPGAE